MSIMRILMLCYEFPPLGGGGSKVVHGLSKELIRSGHDIDIVTMGFRGLPRYEQVDGVSVHRVPCIRTRKSICSTPEMGSYLLSALPCIVRLLKQKRHHLIHTHFIFPDGLSSYLVRKLTGVPYIITAHGSDVPGYNPNRFRLEHTLLSPLWRRIVHDAEQIICPSNKLKSLILEYSSDIKITLIPNGIDTNKFQPAREKQKWVLLVSRMFERKGVQYFLRALEGLYLDHVVNIVGDGPYLGTLQRMTDRLRTPVRFWGWLDNTSPELKELYEKSRIFIFPSAVENFPIVLLEAMAAGMAIITTEDTGCAEVVGDAAILVKSRDPVSIGKALSKLADDADLCRKLGEAARKRLENHFSRSAIARRYSNVYAEYANNT